MLFGVEEKEDKIMTLKEVVLREGEIIGTTLAPLRSLERIVEETQSLRLKVFLSMPEYGF